MEGLLYKSYISIPIQRVERNRIESEVGRLRTPGCSLFRMPFLLIFTRNRPCDYAARRLGGSDHLCLWHPGLPAQDRLAQAGRILLFDGNALGQIAGLIHIQAAQGGDLVGQDL
jgi:hypothetical protein